MKLTHKIAIVTGASSGLGAAITEALVAEQATVYGIARNQEALHQMTLKLGPRFIGVPMDITNGEAIKDWTEKTFSQKHLPQILINNAGAGSFGKIDEMPAEEWFKMINTNLNGMYMITAAVVRLMKQNTESSHIINIGSILGKSTRAEGAAYSATKFGINGFSEALFKEVREDNIKVSCVNPGSIDTGFFKSSGIRPHKTMLQPESIAQSLIHILRTPDNMLISEMTLRPLNPKAPE